MTTASNGHQLHSPVLPPHNLEAEQSALGAILLDVRHLAGMAVEIGLRQEDFYREKHGWVFGAMLALREANEPIDHLTVAEQLERQGRPEQVGGGERSKNWPAGCPPPATAATTRGSCASSPACGSC